MPFFTESVVEEAARCEALLSKLISGELIVGQGSG